MAILAAPIARRGTDSSLATDVRKAPIAAMGRLGLNRGSPTLIGRKKNADHGLNRAGVSCAWVTPTSIITVPSGSVMMVLGVVPTVVACEVAMMAAVT